MLVNGTQTWTVYDGANPYMDFNGSGQLTQRYLTDPTQLSQFLGQVSPGATVEWYLGDNVGSIRQVVSSSGSVLNAVTYGSFGNIVSQTNAGNGVRFMYAGGAYEAAAGSYQFGARYYSPGDGRFMRQDPMKFGAGDTDFYRYVFNQPLQLKDPTGQFSTLNPETFALQAACYADIGMATGAVVTVATITVLTAAIIATRNHMSSYRGPVSFPTIPIGALITNTITTIQGHVATTIAIGSTTIQAGMATVIASIGSIFLAASYEELMAELTDLVQIANDILEEAGIPRNQSPSQLILILEQLLHGPDPAIAAAAEALMASMIEIMVALEEGVPGGGPFILPET
jgi:RHS repeat-associated protein